MEKMLFEEDGVRRYLKFARLIGWEKRKWKSWRGSGEEDKLGGIVRLRVEGGGGWLMKRSKKRRREVREVAKVRARKSREKREKEVSLEVKEARRVKKN